MSPFLPRISKAILGFSVLLIASGCTGAQFLKPPHEERGIKVEDACKYFAKSGLVKNWRDFAGIPFVFEVIDSAGNPAPLSRILIQSKSGNLTLKTDEEGKTTIYFDEALLASNPRVMTADPAHLLGFEFAICFSSKRRGPLSIVKLDSLRMEEVGQDLLYYPGGHDELVGETRKLLPLQRQAIESVLGLPAIQYGVVLTDKSLPLILSDNTVFHANARHTLWPISIPDLDAIDHTIVVHEWFESNLNDKIHFGDKKVRWIADGLSELARIHFVRSLPHSLRDSTGLTQEIETQLGNYLSFINERLEKGESILNFDLIEWTLASPEHPIAGSDVIGYGLALAFWYKIEREFGTELIHKFITQLQNRNKPTGEQTVQLLTELTNTNIKARLTAFDLSAVRNDLIELARELELNLEY